MGPIIDHLKTIHQSPNNYEAVSNYHVPIFFLVSVEHINVDTTAPYRHSDGDMPRIA